MSGWTSFQYDPSDKDTPIKSGSAQPDARLKPASTRKVDSVTSQSKFDVLRSVRAALKEAHHFQEPPKLPSFRPSPSRSSDGSDEDDSDWSFQESDWPEKSLDQAKPVEVKPSGVKPVERNPVGQVVKPAEKKTPEAIPQVNPEVRLSTVKLFEVSRIIDLLSGVADQASQNPGQHEYEDPGSWSDSDLDDVLSSDADPIKSSSSSSSSSSDQLYLNEKYRTFPREWLKSFQKKYPQTGFPVVLDQ